MLLQQFLLCRCEGSLPEAISLFQRGDCFVPRSDMFIMRIADAPARIFACQMVVEDTGEHKNFIQDCSLKITSPGQCWDM